MFVGVCLISKLKMRFEISDNNNNVNRFIVTFFSSFA